MTSTLGCIPLKYLRLQTKKDFLINIEGVILSRISGYLAWYGHNATRAVIRRVQDVGRTQNESHVAGFDMGVDVHSWVIVPTDTQPTKLFWP